MRKVIHEGVPFLCLFSTKPIAAGEELEYNYEKGGSDIYAWLMVSVFIVCHQNKYVYTPGLKL